MSAESWSPGLEVTNHPSHPFKVARRRHFLMCPPTYFRVAYAINPWMDPSVVIDHGLAAAQWADLVETYRAYWHRVDLLEPVDGLPDMVFTANGATVIDGRVLPARFAYAERAAESSLHRAWYQRVARPGAALGEPVAVNEAEGDFAVLGSRVLAGYGFRTARAAHRELAALTGREVISLELVDPRFYHLDLALTVLDDDADHVAYSPAAFSVDSQRVLAELFPDALLVDDHDALAFGLNAVSDGLHVFVPHRASSMINSLAHLGYLVVPIDLSELIKGGGSVKCCTQEIRGDQRARTQAPTLHVVGGPASPSPEGS